jgi:RNA polymerase sigma-70 factor (ECF subfamily)
MPEPSGSLAPAAKDDPHNLAPLLEAAIAGDRLAMDALLLKLRPYLHDLLRKRFGPQPASGLDHSALVQESLIRVFQRLGTLRRPTVPHLLGWAKRIVKNLAIDAERQKKHEAKKTFLIPGAESSRDDSASEERRERLRLRLTEALRQLPERRRQVIQMSFFERVSDEEIGRRLSGSPGAVRVLRCRALDQLRELLRAHAESDTLLARLFRAEVEAGRS